MVITRAKQGLVQTQLRCKTRGEDTSINPKAPSSCLTRRHPPFASALHHVVLCNAVVDIALNLSVSPCLILSLLLSLSSSNFLFFFFRTAAAAALEERRGGTSPMKDGSLCQHCPLLVGKSAEQNMEGEALARGSASLTAVRHSRSLMSSTHECVVT